MLLPDFQLRLCLWHEDGSLIEATETTLTADTYRLAGETDSDCLMANLEPLDWFPPLPA